MTRLSNQEKAVYPKKALALAVLELIDKGEELVKSPLELVGSEYLTPLGYDLHFVSTDFGATTKIALNKAQRKFQMQVNLNAQRFGKLHQQFGDFGELRKQKKAPHTEVFYFQVDVTPENSPEQIKVYRSLQNASSEQISAHVRMCGRHVEGGALSQSNAEIIMDLCYAELNRRLNK